jgi:hypothetical protein
MPWYLRELPWRQKALNFLAYFATALAAHWLRMHDIVSILWGAEAYIAADLAQLRWRHDHQTRGSSRSSRQL